MANRAIYLLITILSITLLALIFLFASHKLEMIKFINYITLEVPNLEKIVQNEYPFLEWNIKNSKGSKHSVFINKHKFLKLDPKIINYDHQRINPLYFSDSLGAPTYNLPFIDVSKEPQHDIKSSLNINQIENLITQQKYIKSGIWYIRDRGCFYGPNWRLFSEIKNFIYLGSCFESHGYTRTEIWANDSLVSFDNCFDFVISKTDTFNLKGLFISYDRTTQNLDTFILRNQYVLKQ